MLGRQPGRRPPAPEVPVTGTRSWQPRTPRAAPGVPRPAAGFSPPRKFGQPGCRAGRDAIEIHISSVSRAYLGSNLLVASSSARGARQVWGAAAGSPGAGAAARGAGAAARVPGAGTRAEPLTSARAPTETP